jgi:hypothetical protein
LRDSRFEVQVKAKFLREGAFDVQNLITIPHAKLLRKLGELTSEQMQDLEDILLVWLGFESEEDEDYVWKNLSLKERRSLFDFDEAAIAILGIEGAIPLQLKLKLCARILNILAT